MNTFFDPFSNNGSHPTGLGTGNKVWCSGWQSSHWIQFWNVFCKSFTVDTSWEGREWANASTWFRIDVGVGDHWSRWKTFHLDHQFWNPSESTIFAEPVPVWVLGWVLEIPMRLENDPRESVRSSNPFNFICVDVSNCLEGRFLKVPQRSRVRNITQKTFQNM